MRSFILSLCFLTLFTSVPALAQDSCTPDDITVRTAITTDHHTYPDTGWKTIKQLPHVWPTSFSGIQDAWYDISWHCKKDAPIAFFLRGMAMAGEVEINHAKLWSDTRLQEPLSHSWNKPRYWLIPANLVKAGENHIRIHTIGAVTRPPGLERIKLGTPEDVYPTYLKMLFFDSYLFLANIAMSLTLSCLFFFLWLLRRKEVVYGWFASSSFFWAMMMLLQMTPSAWPFANTPDWSTAGVDFYLVHSASFCLFVINFAKPRSKRLAYLLGGITLIIILALWLIPDATKPLSLSLALLAYISLFVLVSLGFIFMSCKHLQKYNLMLSLCLFVLLIIAIHDTLALFQVIRSPISLTPISSVAILLAMSFILASRHARNIRKIRELNQALLTRIDKTRKDLTHTLQEKYQHELINSTLIQRLQIHHDLHDGLGSSLVRFHTMLEHSTTSPSKSQVLSMLDELRGDLREIINGSDNAVSQAHQSPKLWVAPLRRRFNNLFQEMGIRADWQIAPAWFRTMTCRELTAMSRCMEEALTNIVKHSHCNRVIITIHSHSWHDKPLISIEDNGKGFDQDKLKNKHGIGLKSMNRRIHGVNGKLMIQSTAGCTRLTIELPHQATPTAVNMNYMLMAPEATAQISQNKEPD